MRESEEFCKKKEMIGKKGKGENIINRLISKIFPQEEQEDMDIILKNMISSDDFSEQNSEMNKFSLQFKNPDLEKKFRQSIVKSWLQFNKYSQLGILFLFELMQLLIQSVKSSSEPQLDYIIGQTIGSIFISSVTIIMFTSKGEKQFFKLNFFILLFRIITKIFTDILMSNENSLESFAFSYFLNFSVLCRPDFVMYGSLLEAFVFFMKYSISSSFQSNVDRYISLSIILFTTAYCLFCIQAKYQYETVERQDYLSQNKLRIESAKINNILAILLPKFVRDRISNSGEIQLAENQGDVAVLFCDICDFDNILQSENEKIVALLDNLFRNFDILCSQNDCTKIETVGKTYVAASGLNLELQNKKKQTTYNSVERLVNLGFDMQDYVKNISWGKNGDKMRVKIGIHYGRVMAGVIGYHKPQFSLIGDTINTTSRVMSTGEDNRMTISSQAQAKIQMHNLNNYRMNRKEVEAKGKGVMVTYQVFRQNQKYIKGTSKKTEVFKPGSKQTTKGIFQKTSPIKRTYLDSKNLMQSPQMEERKSSHINAKSSQQNQPMSPGFQLNNPISNSMQQAQQIKLAMGGIKSVNLTRKVVKKNTIKLNYQPHQFSTAIANVDINQNIEKKSTLMSPIKLKSVKLLLVLFLILILLFSQPKIHTKQIQYYPHNPIF